MANSDLIQSVVRSLDILEAVARSEDGLTLQQLSDQLVLQASTAHNLARTLLAKGYLSKSTRPVKYRLGFSLQELINMQCKRTLLKVASEKMQQLSQDMPEATITLAEDMGGEIIVALRLSPDRPGSIQHNNRIVSPFKTSTSLVFLSFWSDRIKAAYMNRYPVWEFGLPMWKDETQLEQAIGSIRCRGYASLYIEKSAIFSVSAPIFNNKNSFVAAIGLSFSTAAGSKDPLREDQAIERILEAASEIGLNV